MCNVVVMFCWCRCKNIRLGGKRHREIYKLSLMQRKRLVTLHYFINLDIFFEVLSHLIMSVLTVSSILGTTCENQVLLSHNLKFKISGFLLKPQRYDTFSNGIALKN